MDIPGLIRLPRLLAAAHQQACVARIDAAPWRADLRRRTQHYGWVYDYTAKTVQDSAYLGPLPPWLALLGRAVSAAAGLDVTWSQAIVNEYRPGQGIGAHADARAFGPFVATVSLLAATTIRFRPSFRAAVEEPVLVEPGDCLVLTGPSRSPWTHEIRGQDVLARRVSITFRTVQREPPAA